MERGPRQKGVEGRVSLERPPDSQLGWTWTGGFPVFALWLAAFPHLKLGYILCPWDLKSVARTKLDSMLFINGMRYVWGSS